MKKDSKMIRVTSRGMVNTSRGRVFSPIMSPYRESINRIWSMLTVDRATIEEKLPDNTFVKLNIHNYDKDNTIKNDVASKTPNKIIKEESLKIVPPTASKSVEKMDATVTKKDDLSNPLKEATNEVVEVVTEEEKKFEDSVGIKDLTPIEDMNNTDIESLEDIEDAAKEEIGDVSEEENELETLEVGEDVEDEAESPYKNNKKNRKRNKNQQK